MDLRIRQEWQEAYRRKITIGRQNPQYYEVIEAWSQVSRLSLAAMKAYKDNDVLVFN